MYLSNITCGGLSCSSLVSYSYLEANAYLIVEPYQEVTTFVVDGFISAISITQGSHEVGAHGGSHVFGYHSWYRGAVTKTQRGNNHGRQFSRRSFNEDVLSDDSAGSDIRYCIRLVNYCHCHMIGTSLLHNITCAHARTHALTHAHIYTRTHSHSNSLLRGPEQGSIRILLLLFET